MGDQQRHETGAVPQTLDPKKVAIRNAQRKQDRQKPLFAPDAEKFMRAQVIDVFDKRSTAMITTTEHKKRQKSVKEKEAAVEEVEKQVAKVHAKKIQKDAKSETIKKYMQYMTQQAILQKEASKITLLPKEPSMMETASNLEISESENLLENEMEYEEEEENEELHGDTFTHEIEPSRRIPSWTYFDQFGEDDEGIHVSVGTDSKERAQTPAGGKPKMFNVSLGVKPKDITKVYHSKPYDPNRPKMYNVAVGVGPTEDAMLAAQAKREKKMREDRRMQMMREAKRRQMMRDGLEWLGEYETFGEYDLDLLPEDELTEEELAERRRRHKQRMERIRLARKESKQRDAAAWARPVGYRDLDLTIPFDTLPVDNETQVNEFDIEKTMAAKRGIILKDGNILWPMSRDFTEELGRRKIQDFIHRNWKLDKEWKYHVKFIQTHNTNYRRKYIFEVQFSTPTNWVPIPPATASVFFVFEIEHYASLDDTIKVRYVFEGCRFVHTPGRVPFNQKWLHGIIADKLRIQRSLNF